MSLEIDHVVVCVPDLAHNPFPLTAVPGGRHEGHGTANSIVPLGDSYIELVSVVDADEARDSPFGSWVADRSQVGGVHALCLRTSDIESLGNDLGLDVTAMSRLKPDGIRLSWRIAGFDQTLEAGRPFFIQWDDTNLHPGRSDVNGDAHIQSVVVSGALGDLATVLGPVADVSFVEGEPSVKVSLAGV